jgi:ribonuclease-3 family protein
MSDTWFPHPPAKPADQLHPLALAYIGDAVYEVYIRQYLLSKPNHRPNHLHREATRFVAAKSQARMLLDCWMPGLTDEEREIVRRGVGAKSGTAPKSADMIEYRQSTAFECLIGYLYYTGRNERLNELLDRAVRHMEEG